MKKFRVWDKEQRKYLNEYNVHHLENNDGIFSIVLNMDIQKISGNDRFKIEWSTGLFDSGGEEIYEGDIIKHGSPLHYYESVVIFKAPSFLAANFYYKSQKYLRIGKEWYVEWEKKGIEAFQEGYYRTNMQLVGDNYCEVIGNINENPKLL